MFIPRRCTKWRVRREGCPSEGKRRPAAQKGDYPRNKAQRNTREEEEEGGEREGAGSAGEGGPGHATV